MNEYRVMVFTKCRPTGFEVFCGGIEVARFVFNAVKTTLYGGINALEVQGARVVLQHKAEWAQVDEFRL